MTKSEAGEEDPGNTPTITRDSAMTDPANKKEDNVKEKEANGGDTQVKEGAGEIAKEATETPSVDSEKKKSLKKIEQRPFLTQSELLIKMKAGEEEEVKRCQDLSL